MTLSLDLQRQLARFTRLPQRDDIWEGAIVPLPTWVEGEGGDPFRPMAAVWVSATVRVGHSKMPKDQSSVDESAAIAALIETGSAAKPAAYRPARIHVRDEWLASTLTRALDGASTGVELMSELPALDLSSS
jgi:hypothetical protein